MKRTPFLFAPLAFLALAVPLLAHQFEEAKLVASDAQPGDAFGRSVAVAGEVVVVGAPGADALGVDSGAAYVFEDNGVAWVETAKLVPSDGAAFDSFGISVAISGTTIVVGAPGQDGVGVDTGAMYVFQQDLLGAWNQTAKLEGVGALPGETLGGSVAVDGSTIVGGAVNLGNVGAAYVFDSVGGVWAQSAKLLASDGGTGQSFGKSVSISQDSIAVGAILANGAASRSGAAYLFDRQAGLWSETTKITAANGNTGDFYGASVSIFNSEILVVGAPGDDDAGNSSGSAYNYHLLGGTWTQSIQRLGARAGDLFGGAVSYAYRSTLVGVRSDDQSAPNVGSAKLYASLPGKIGFQVYVTGDQDPGDLQGASVAAGACDMVTGAPGDDAAGLDAGAAYIYVLQHAAAVLANGNGINPVCMVTTAPPVTGSNWLVNVDTTAIPGADITDIYLYNRFLTRPRIASIGEVLVDRSSGLVLHSQVAGFGVVQHSIPIPNDPYMVGLDFAAQGLVRSSAAGNRILSLCNGETITIGCHPPDVP